MAAPKKYPDELMDRGVRLVFESGRPITHVARDLVAGTKEGDRRTIAKTSAWPGMESAAIADDTVAGERAVRYRVLRPRGPLTEWKFAHHGWLFVAGVYCRDGDSEPEVLRLASRALSTWRWTEVHEGEDPLSANPR